LRDQRLVSTLASNQLFPNVTLKRSEQALIDLVDGLSSGLIVLVNVTNDDLADHDAYLGGRAVKRLQCHEINYLSKL
jgi:hypothetical protein